VRPSGSPPPAEEALPALPPPARRLYCNRTLNLRAIRAIGFDMDYTLVHYDARVWERRAWEYLRDRLLARGFPVDHLAFDDSIVAMGLVLDTRLGNLVKANRFGFVRRASHGTRMLSFDEQRAAYERTIVDLAEKRWVFVNTLFGLSEACMFAQLVDLLDEGRLDPHGFSGSAAHAGPTGSYGQLYETVRCELDATHAEGALKAEIMASPERYVQLDPELPLALTDLACAGKRLVLITNSEWDYTDAMMRYAFDGFLGKSWRSLFDLVFVGARKPYFFTERMPAFEVIDEGGRLLPVRGRLVPGRCYLGGHANLVEEGLGLSGESILYMGDHVFSDVNISKAINRWRTGFVLRALEDELAALESFRPQQRELTALMAEKERLELGHAQFRLAVQRLDRGYGPVPPDMTRAELCERIAELGARIAALDEQLAPLAEASGRLGSERWGLLLRTGNDKSHLARQIERHADIYTSRVSNFLFSTPFAFLRSPRSSLPHDSAPEGGVAE
jgi:HAD superfamily 5'-nucleotidase-like hydrolase